MSAQVTESKSDEQIRAETKPNSTAIEKIKPQGRIGSISDPTAPVDLRQLKGKSVSFHWELMFTRAM